MTVHDQLAVEGGPPAVTLEQTEANRWPIITDEDEQAVLRILRDGDLSTHPVIRELESAYCEYFGVRHSLAHCNGTMALLAAYFALDLKPGDEVIVPSATWWSSVLPMLWLGAIPVFAETEPQRGGLDADDVRRKITSRTRAIVIVHLWGMPSRMTGLLELAEAHGLAIVEDASHAHGAIWRGRKCGTLGDVAVFSLQGHKLAPAGEGGVLVTERDDLIEQAKLLGDVTRILELDTPARRFAATGFGMKTRIAPLSAAVAKTQLRHLDERNARRNANIERLSHRLEALGLDTFLPPAHVERVYFEFLIRPGDRLDTSHDELITALQAEGVDVQRPRYPLVHEQPFFTEGHFASIARLPEGIAAPEYHADALPRTREANASLLRLPTFPSATDALIDQYTAAFEKVVSRLETGA